MKKLLLPLFTAIIAAASFTGCNHADYKAEMKVVDSLKTSVEKSEKILNSIVAPEINGYTQIILADIDSAKSTLERKKLTISRDDAVFFGRYKALTASVGSFNALYNKLGMEAEKSREQLTNLKTDLVNRTIEEDKAKQYINAEKNSVNSLNDAVIHLDSVVKNIREKFKPYRENFVERMANITKGKEKAKKKK